MIFPGTPGRFSDYDHAMRSNVGKGPKGDGIIADVVRDDPYGVYRVQFKNSRTGEVYLTTPNMDPGSRIYFCNLTLQYQSSEDTDVSYTVPLYVFSTQQVGTIRDARVGDMVFYKLCREGTLGANAIGIGIITNLSLDGNVTFMQHSVLDIENIDEIDARVRRLQEDADNIEIALDAVQSTLNDLPNYDEFLGLSESVRQNESDITTKIPWPVTPYSKYGTDGQVLRTNADGSTQWQNPVIPTDTQAETYINAWLNAHPEATTTVQDGSITTAKLADGVVTDEKLAQSGGVLEKVDGLKNVVDASILFITNIANPANKVLNERYANANPVTARTEANYQRLEVAVNEGQTYSVWNINGTFSFYSNANHDNLGAIQNNGNITIPDGCDRLLLSFSGQNKEFIVINKSGYLNGVYEYGAALEVDYPAFDISDYAPYIEVIASTRNIANPAKKVLNERYLNSDPVRTTEQPNYQRLEVPVMAGKTYSVWNINTAFSVFSDDAYTNLGLISSEGNITTPAGCTKLLLTFSGQNKEFIVINAAGYPNGNYAYNVPISNNAEDAHYDYTSISMFPAIGIVGDSFESGGIYINEQTLWGMFYDSSWPSVMARRCGSVVNNYSAAGLSTRTWLTNTGRGLSKALSDAPSGLYMLMLGINDYGLDNYLGTIDDIKTDYTQNPDTFYGNYARIYEQLIAHAPTAKFIFVVPPLITASYQNAIEAIASHYSVPSFRSLSDTFFSSDFYTDNRATAHPVAMTYAGMALAYERLVSLCIQDNASYFFNYH